MLNYHGLLLHHLALEILQSLSSSQLSFIKYLFFYFFFYHCCFLLNLLQLYICSFDSLVSSLLDLFSTMNGFTIFSDYVVFLLRGLLKCLFL